MPSIKAASVSPLNKRPSFLTDQEWSDLSAAMRLSQRERDIACHLMEGMREAAIGHCLGISVHTVHSHIRRVYGKMRVADRCGLAMRFFAGYAEMAKGPPPKSPTDE